MDLTEFKCSVCQKEFTKKDVQEIKQKVLDGLYDKKNEFTKEDDFDTACCVVEQIFDSCI